MGVTAIVPELLTVQEAADYLGVSRQTVWRLCKAGELRKTVIRGCERISRRELERLVDRKTRAAK